MILVDNIIWLWEHRRRYTAQEALVETIAGIICGLIVIGIVAWGWAR